jgi:NADH pyrophosphatase NudC (nudix superfamily)
MTNILTSEKFAPHTGVVVVIKKDNKYLLVKQNKEPYKNFWAPVHGAVELNESDEEAVIRETLEEIGVLVKPLIKLGVSNADYKVKKLHWWLAKHQSGNITIDSSEISEYGYFLPQDIIKLNLLSQAKKFFRLLFTDPTKRLFLF